MVEEIGKALKIFKVVGFYQIDDLEAKIVDRVQLAEHPMHAIEAVITSTKSRILDPSARFTFKLKAEEL